MPSIFGLQQNMNQKVIAIRTLRKTGLGLLVLGLFSDKCFAAALPPVITRQPTNQTVLIHGAASFEVAVTSLSTLSYQWRNNGANIPGATSNSLRIANALMSDQGNYSVSVTNAGGWAISSNAALTVIQTAPTLDPTKHPILTPESANAGNPPGATGTLVSQLVDFATPSGQVDNVIDPDAGALLGIAVTAADTTQGNWWYSTNDGLSWSNLGAVNEMTARLLAADAGTRIYFQPNTNWNGTLTNAITFRAWDQTTGANGGTAVARSSGNMLDTFSAVAYTNNNGTNAWSGGWVDIDGSATAGSIIVARSTGRLELTVNNSSDWIYREANLSGVNSATVSFNYNSQLNAGKGGRVDLQVSGNGGTTYTTVATFSATTNFGIGTFSADITPYAAPNTRIRFLITAKSSPLQRIDFDNVQIAFTAAVGGTSAFSVAQESATLTVIPPNHAPVANTQSVTIASGSAKLITLTASDGDSNPLSFAIVTPPTHGVISAFSTNTGTLTYTANSTYSGLDSFTFIANDGMTNSAPATVRLTVTAVAPAITAQPQSQSVWGGQSVSFFVAASGTAPLGYQWKLNGAALPGATGSTLVLANAQPTNAGNYSVMITNTAGSVTSAAAALTVIPPTPPSLSSASMTANGFRFQLSVPVGATYILSTSTNLQDWTPISTNVAPVANVVVTDPAATNFARRFYRAMLIVNGGQ